MREDAKCAERNEGRISNRRGMEKVEILLVLRLSGKRSREVKDTSVKVIEMYVVKIQYI